MPRWMMTSQPKAVVESGACRSMKVPKFQSAIADTKYAKTRLSRLPGLRSREIPARETFRRNAMRGSSLWRLNHGPLDTPEGKQVAIAAALLLDLVLEDPEDHDVPVPAVAQRRLAQRPFVREAVAPQRVDAQGVVLVRLGLQSPQAESVDAIVAHEAAGLHAEAPPGGPGIADDGLDAGVAFRLVD